MGFWDGISSAFDSAMDFVGYGDDAPADSGYQTSIMSDLDIDGNGSIGSKPISSYDPNVGYGANSSYDYDGLAYNPVSTPAATNTPKPEDGKSFWDSLTSPNVLGAAITAGAGLFGGMSNLNAQKEAMKAAQEEKKMNQLLELAKLKYQLMGKGAGGGGRGRSGGASKAGQIDAQYSNALASGYNTVGGNIAATYR